MVTRRTVPVEVMTVADHMARANWGMIVDLDKAGACIPASFTLMWTLNEMGIPARMVECRFKVEVTGDARTAESYGNEETGFLGHVIVYVPQKRLLLDVGLKWQASKVIPLAMPDPGFVYVGWDHTGRFTDAVSSLPNGKIHYYDLALKWDGWSQSNMPWEELKTLGKNVAGQMEALR